MFCASHTIPHEDCPSCRTTIAAIRPTIFAELAAVELCSGTESCPDCDYVYYEAVASCPQCGEPHPFHPRRRLASVDFVGRHAVRDVPVETSARSAVTHSS